MAEPILELESPQLGKLELICSQETLEKSGQHGAPMIFETVDGSSRWLFKLFVDPIDSEFQSLNFDEINFELGPEENKGRSQFIRAINELVAGRIAQLLKLTVPDSVIVTSSNVAKLDINPDKRISLPDDVKMFDPDDRPETYEEIYGLGAREEIMQRSGKEFDNLLLQYAQTRGYSGKTPDGVLGVLNRMVPNSMTLEDYLDYVGFDRGVKTINSIDRGYHLLPFDVWLNDPDRNAGNYLIELEDDEALDIYGIDYEMWSFGMDIIPEEDITRGRSYLAAVIHGSTNVHDQRILETIFRIRALGEKQVRDLARLPTPFVKFVEYNIKKKNIDADEREKVLQTDQQLKDFLWETKPRLSRLELFIAGQISGLPREALEEEE